LLERSRFGGRGGRCAPTLVFLGSLQQLEIDQGIGEVAMVHEKPPIATLPEDDVVGFHVEDPETLGSQIPEHLGYEVGGLMS
jgi:hypothetical protein